MSNFSASLVDYRYFKSRGYPHKAVLKIIGDHYRLTKIQRNCLFRGVVDPDACEKTREKILTPDALESKVLGVDWFNVMITVESYLKGNPLFISDDGIVRDSSGVHGSYTISQITERAMREIFAQIETLSLSKLEVFLDSPISHSGDIAQSIREKADTYVHCKIEISLVQSADYPLKTFHGVVASSDTIIIEHSRLVFDLARYVLSTSFDYRPPDLDSLVI